MTKMQDTLRLGPNQKIILHWTFVVPIIGFLLSRIVINPIGISIMVGLLLLTIILNRTTYMRLENNSLTVIKKNLLFIETFKKVIDLNKVNKLIIEDLGHEFPLMNPITFGYGESAIKLFSGYSFYEPRYLISYMNSYNESDSIYVNTQNIDIKKLRKMLQAKMKSDFEFVRFTTNSVEHFNKGKNNKA